MLCGLPKNRIRGRYFLNMTCTGVDMTRSILNYLEESTLNYGSKTACADEHTAFTYEEPDRQGKEGSKCAGRKDRTKNSSSCVHGQEPVMHFVVLWVQYMRVAFM